MSENLDRPKGGFWATSLKARRHFGRFISDQRSALWAGGSAAFGAAILELVRPWPIKIVLDEVILPSESGGVDWLRDFSSTQILAASALALFLVPTLLGVFNRWSVISLAVVGRKVTTRVRRHICEHLQLLPLSFHHRSETGDLIVRVMGDVNMIRDILFSGWISLVQRTLFFLATLGILFWFDPAYAGLALLPLPFFFLTIRRSGPRMKSAVAKQRKKEGGAAALATELLSQIRVVKAFGAERRSARLFAGLSRAGEKAGVKAARIASASVLQTEMATGLGVAAVLWFGARSVMEGDLSAGTLVLLLSYTRALYKPLRKIGRDAVRLAKAAACAERLFEVLELPTEESPGGIQPPALEGAIRAESLAFSYGRPGQGLLPTSFEIPAGSLAVLSGHNGCGKSTTLGLLLRLFEPDSGRLLVDEQDILQFDLDAWRSRFAYVPQEDLFFSGSVAENLRFADPEATDDQLRNALRRCRLADYAEHLDRQVGEQGQLLSGGQRRLLSLARAAIRNADILLLDEPLEGLDPEARREVAEAVRSIAAGRTTLVVSHTSLTDIAPDLEIDFSLVHLNSGRMGEPHP